MNLFSRNIGLIFKTFLYQIVMSLFGLMMYGALSGIPFLLFVGCSFVILFFWYIMFQQMYQQGYKNQEYDHGHGTRTPLWIGFLFAILAFLPTALLAVWSLSAPPFDPSGATTNGYIPFLLNKSFLQGMYQYVHQAIIPPQAGTDVLNGHCMLHLISVIPGILLCGIGYLVGCFRFGKKEDQ